MRLVVFVAVHTETFSSCFANVIVAVLPDFVIVATLPDPPRLVDALPRTTQPRRVLGYSRRASRSSRTMPAFMIAVMPDVRGPRNPGHATVVSASQRASTPGLSS